MRRKLLFDCDNTLGLFAKEIDDGLALLYFLGRPDIELLGVTTTFGNGSGTQTFQQTRQLLQTYECEEVPVCQGADKGGQPPGEAAHFLAETAAAQPGEITLVATGPLSNLYAAAQLDPTFFYNLQQIVCMGGYLQPLRIGWRNLSELNFSADPRAAWTVLNATCPLTVMSAQICLQAPFVLSDFSRLGFLDPKMLATMGKWLLAFGIYCGVRRFYLWDLLPAVYFSYPDLFDRQEVAITSTVEDLSRGLLAYAPPREQDWSTNLPSHILDVERFKAIVFTAWQKCVSS